MNRTVLIIVGIVTLLVAGISTWFFTNYERYEKEVRVGFSGKAAKDPYYAAELFLKKYNMEVKSLSSILKLKQMPSSKDILFIPTKRFDIGADRVSELMDWVNEGGHLIALARYNRKDDYEATDELFDTLGVRTDHKFDVLPILDLFMEKFDEQDKSKKVEHEKEAEDSNPDTADDKPGKQDSKKTKQWRRSVLTVHVNDQIEDKQVQFWQSKWMVNEGRYKASWEVQGRNGAQLIEFHIGQGWVTLLSEIDFMTNYRIDKYDHAAFLYTLVHIDNSHRKLWIIQNDDSPSLLAIIFDKYKPAVLVFIVFVLFWIWYASRRFGPVTPDPQPVRRSMSEHIVSTGHFQWRNKNRMELLNSVQKALHEQIVQTRPLWVRLSEKELATKLAKLAGLEEQRVYKAITAKSVDKELDFATTIEVFSTIRKKL
ncbi:MAG: DUF4350 domain-containing protein [Thioalkalispiraceae bacterium]|jgi:hypothetical protein